MVILLKKKLNRNVAYSTTTSITVEKITEGTTAMNNFALKFYFRHFSQSAMFFLFYRMVFLSVSAFQFVKRAFEFECIRHTFCMSDTHLPMYSIFFLDF